MYQLVFIPEDKKFCGKLHPLLVKNRYTKDFWFSDPNAVRVGQQMVDSMNKLVAVSVKYGVRSDIIPNGSYVLQKQPEYFNEMIGNDQTLTFKEAVELFGHMTSEFKKIATIVMDANRSMNNAMRMVAQNIHEGN